MSARIASRKKINHQRKTTPAALKRKADALAGALVRARGYCESGRSEHSGPLQWAHGFSRTYRAVRWDLRNGFCLCAGCHFFFTHRPIEWDEWMQQRMGAAVYAEVRRSALSSEKRPMSEVIEELEKASERKAA